MLRKYGKAAALFAAGMAVAGMAMLLSWASAVLAAEPTAAVAPAPLERLKYNHPGLQVDLGVGLWAWPMVLDHDGDGDLDLLVACPDKPSNGVYFFENPAGSNVKFPVFKPGVRLGPATQNMRLSWAGGVPQLTAANRLFPKFREGDFKSFTRLAENGDVSGAKHVRQNTWHYADLDGDGRDDLLVGQDVWDDLGWFDTNDWWKGYDAQGRWTRGQLHGWVFWLRNEGTSQAPKYAEAVALETTEGRLEVAGWPSPCAADFDGDGDLDLVCSEFLDGLTYFQNISGKGSAEKPAAPKFAAGVRLSDEGRPIAMELQMIVPTAADWDGDGDFDLVVGDEDGRVALVENTGLDADKNPRFNSPRYFRQEADDVKCGALATPVGFDWDGDGDEDLVSGNTAGFVEFFENLSGPKAARPTWAAPARLAVDGKPIRILAGPDGSIQGPVEAKWGYTTISVADWDHDGLPDVVLNSILGCVVWHRNVGIRTAPRLAAAEPIEAAWTGPAPALPWARRPPKNKEVVSQWRTTPVAVDFTGDGLLDLVMLDHEGYLALFERRKSATGALELAPPRRCLADANGKPLRMNGGEGGRSGRRKLCVVDWDGDGRLDVLANGRNAQFHRRLPAPAGEDGTYRFAAPVDVGDRNIEGHDTSPTTVDFDGDGVRDLLIGAEDGKFYFIKNTRSGR